VASTIERLTEAEGRAPGRATGGHGDAGASSHRSPLARLGRWTATHFRAVLLMWLVVIGAFGVFVFIAAAMAIVMATIGLFGPRTTNLSLEKISH